MKKRNLKEIFKGANPDAIDLLEQMLELDADRRPTAEQALAHKYLAQYADPSDEPSAEPYDDSFEDKELSVLEWKSEFSNAKSLDQGHKLTIPFFLAELVYDETTHFKPAPPPE